MIGFIHCGSEKIICRYRFPSGNQLAGAREEGGWLNKGA